MSNVCVVAVVLVLAATNAFAGRPVIRAVETLEPPKIDGDISDKCWRKATKIRDFYLLTDGSKPSERTEAWICYDKQNIYVAFYCHDSQPDAIVARQTKRDQNFGIDDRVELAIDCYNNGQQVIWAGLNPAGTQYERLQSGDVSKIEWRGDWRGAARRTKDGYTAEMALPFSVLHYDPKCKSLGVTFGRYHARTQTWWAAPYSGTTWEAQNFIGGVGSTFQRIRISRW